MHAVVTRRPDGSCSEHSKEGGMGGRERSRASRTSSVYGRAEDRYEGEPFGSSGPSSSRSMESVARVQLDRELPADRLHVSTMSKMYESIENKSCASDVGASPRREGSDHPEAVNLYRGSLRSFESALRASVEEPAPSEEKLTHEPVENELFRPMKISWRRGAVVDGLGIANLFRGNPPASGPMSDDCDLLPGSPDATPGAGRHAVYAPYHPPSPDGQGWRVRMV